MADAIQELTPAEWEFVDKFVEEHSRIDRIPLSADTLRPAVDALYEALGATPPKEIVCFESKKALLEWQKEMGQQPGTDGIGFPQRRWLAHFRCVIDELKKLPPDDDSRLAGRIYPLSMCVYDSAVYDTHYACIMNPRVDRDADWELHSETRAAFHWKDDDEAYFWHGVRVPKEVITDPESMVSKAMELSTEVRRALCEKLGWSKALELMGAELKSEQEDEKTGLAYSLYRLPSGEQVLKKESPALQNGAQPFYCEQVDENLETALGARKWQVPWERLGLEAPSPEDCDEDPSLEYGWEK